MTDEDRQAERLRTKLDHELASVHATAEARERLDSRISPSISSPPIRWNMRRLPVVLALPLAAASVVVAVVAVPALVRSDTPGTPASGGGQPSRPAPEATATRTPTPGPAPVPQQSIRDSTEPAPADSNARIIMTPTTAAIGGRVALSVIGTPRRFGNLTVSWGDGSADTVKPHSCSARTAAAETPLAHSYTRAGTYEVRVVIARCSNDAVVPALSRRVTVAAPVAQPR